VLKEVKQVKYFAAGTLSLSMAATAAHAQGSGTSSANEALRTVSPALEAYTTNDLYGGVWQRPDLSARDRSIVTVASLIARNQAADMPAEFNRALENGVTAAELSEIITHLAFYAGWGNATTAIAVTQEIFAERGVGAEELPKAGPELLPLDEQAEAQRESRVQEDYGAVSQGVVDYTRDLLFRDLWLRPGLEPRDRSLVTVSALISAGQVAQMPFHLNRAMDNGLTQAQASEVLTHLAFYAGWPNVFSALPVAREVFEARAEQ
jgi:4-carboxymuconolactone decarboxylase